MKHNGFFHVLLTAILWGLFYVLFPEQGLWGTVFAVSGDYISILSGVGGGNVAQSTNSMAALLPIIFGLIVNIVIYYLLAAIIIFIWNLIFERT